MDTDRRTGGTVAQPRGGQDWTSVWASALDDLELEVARAERLLDSLHSTEETHHPAEGYDADGGVLDVPWLPPRIDAPLPSSLEQRARLLLERQLATAGRLATAMTTSRRHLNVVEGLAQPASRPMYVDRAL